MNAQIVETGIRGKDLEEVADRAIQMLQIVRAKRQGIVEGTGQIQSTGRLFSQTEIANELGLSVSKINRHFAAKESNNPEKTNKTYRHTQADLFEARLKLAKLPNSVPCPVTIGIANFKGGVSKSTLTAHLANYLAQAGYTVLAIDMDPQGTLSSFFGMNPDYEIGVDDTLIPYFYGDEPNIKYAIRKTELPNLSVIPATLGLAEADMILPSRVKDDKGWNYTRVLKDGLATVADDYDFILIDCPPSLSYLTTISTRACDLLIVPLRPAMPDLASSAQFLKMFGRFTQEIDGEFDKEIKEWANVKMVITQGRKQGTSSIVEEDIRWIYGDMVLAQVFPHKAAIEAAARRFRTVYDVAAADIDRNSRIEAQTIVNELCGTILNAGLRSSQWLHDKKGELL